MTAIRGVGWLWQPNDEEEKRASLDTRLNLAIEEFRRRWGTMPQCCFTSEKLSDDLSDIAVPVHYDDGVTPHHLWLKFPFGFDFREVKNRDRTTL